MDTDLLSELRSLGDDPEPIDPAAVGLTPSAGISQTARELEADGTFEQLTRKHAEERKRAEDSAWLKSRDSLVEGITDPQQYAEALKGIVPGAVRFVGGTAPKGLAAADPIEAVAANAQKYMADLRRVPEMGPQELAAFRRRVERESAPATRIAIQSAISDLLDGGKTLADIEQQFAATPLEKRPLYTAGEAVTEFSRGILPPAKGYEESVGRQLGEGLGSMVGGLPFALFGSLPAAVVFGAGGIGEAAERAVAFDRAEKAAGRPGLTEEQINTAALLGVAPGTTDILPIEVMLGRLPMPLPPWLRGAVARAIGRVGGQALVEGFQEGGQQFLQNLIAREVYDPGQGLMDEVPGNIGLGGGVGAIAQGAKEVGAWLLRSAAGRRGRRPAEQKEPERPAEEQPESQPEAAPQAEQPPPEEQEAVSPEEAADFLKRANPALADELGLIEPAEEAPAEGEETAAEAAPEAEAPVAEEVQAEPVEERPDVAVAREGVQTDTVAGMAVPREGPLKTRVPTFEDVRALLPKDENGDPDLVLLQERINALGKRSWADLTIPEKAALYREFVPEGRAVETPTSVPAAGEQSTIPATPEQAVVQAVSEAIQGEAAQTASPPAPAQEPAPALQEGQETAVPEEPRDLYADFRSILAGKSPRREWAKQLGITGDDLQPLIQQALAEGLLAQNKNGVLRRTGKAKSVSREGTAPAGAGAVTRAPEPARTAEAPPARPPVRPVAAQPSGPTLTIPPEVRLDTAREVRERITGRPVNQLVMQYAERIELARGTDEFETIWDELKADRLILKADMLDLAALVGYPPKSRTTKAEALSSIRKRHEDVKSAREASPAVEMFAIHAWHASPNLFAQFERAYASGVDDYPGAFFFSPREAISGPSGTWSMSIADTWGQVHIYEVEIDDSNAPVIDLAKRWDEQAPEARSLLERNADIIRTSWIPDPHWARFNGEPYDLRNPAHLAGIAMASAKDRSLAIANLEHNLRKAERSAKDYGLISRTVSRLVGDTDWVKLWREARDLVKRGAEPEPDLYNPDVPLAVQFAGSWGKPPNLDKMGFEIVRLGDDEIMVLNPNRIKILAIDGRPPSEQDKSLLQSSLSPEQFHRRWRQLNLHEVIEDGDGDLSLFAGLTAPPAAPPRSFGLPALGEPPISSFTTDKDIKSHASYKAAKSGDFDAAVRLVRDLVKPQNIADARARFGADAIYVPVVAEETTGKNAIPLATALFYADSAGGLVSTDIVQTSRAYHTGARPLDRLISRPRFAGPVQNGGRYVLVDDVTVMGGTLAELANYIRSNGGEVVGVVTLVNASRAGLYRPNPRFIRQIEERYGQTVREEFGIEPQALTADEAQYIIGFRDADELRGAIAKAVGERGRRLLARGLRPSAPEGVGRPPSAEVMLAGLSALADAQSQRRAFDQLGFYSQALEAAKALKQAKGTPEQMRAQLKAAGVKDAEIAATGLDEFLKDKKSVTRDEIVKHLEDNRAQVREVVYGEWSEQELNKASVEEIDRIVELDDGRFEYKGTIFDEFEDALDAVEELLAGRFAKWARYSLDPDNPTYRETVLHLSGRGADFDFQSGHWSEPNVIAHIRSSIHKDEEGRPVYVIEELQSDWGQRLRDKGVRDEAKIAELKKQLRDLTQQGIEALGYRTLEEIPRLEGWTEFGTLFKRLQWGKTARGFVDEDTPQGSALRKLGHDLELLSAELRTAEAATPGHPLVNTTDQWVNTALRRAIRQAIEAGADKIAIPSGDTILSYGMGGEPEGQRYAYDRMYPKNLRNILQKLDKSLQPQKIDTLISSLDGRQIGDGFTVFPLTDKVKQAVLEEGMPLFAGIGRQPLPATLITSGAEFAQTLALELRRMLPAEIAIRVEDRIVHAGRSAEGIFDPVERLVRIATAYGFDQAMNVAKHETIHALRALKLFTDQEWSKLVAHARKIGTELVAHDARGNRIAGVAAEAIYRQFYTERRRQRYRELGYDPDHPVNAAQIRQAVDVLIDEEYVAHMAEQWVTTPVRYGRAIDALLERMRRVFDAVVQALHAMGITSLEAAVERAAARDIQRIAESVLSGVRAGNVDPRTGQSRIEPFFAGPSPAQRILASTEGQAAVEALRSSASGQAMLAFGGAKAAGADMGSLARAETLEKQRRTPQQIWRETGWYRGPDGLWRFEIDDSEARLLVDIRPQDERQESRREFEGKLPDILSHPTLYEQYPILRDIDVHIGLGDYYVGGRSGVASGTITVQLGNDATAEDVTGIILHEVQHLIQEIEGFTGGGHPKSIALTNQIRLFEIEQEIERNEAAGVGHNVLPYLRQARDAIRQSLMLTSMSFYGPQPGAMEAYRRLFGEIEARNVMARRALTAEERRATFPEATQDRKTAEAIATEEPVAARFDPEIMQQIEAAFAEIDRKHGGVLSARTSSVREATEIARDGIEYRARQAADGIAKSTQRIVKISARLRGADLAALRGYDSDERSRVLDTELRNRWRETISKVWSPAARKLRALLEIGNEEHVLGVLQRADPPTRALIDQFPALANAVDAMKAHWEAVDQKRQVLFLEEQQQQLRYATALAAFYDELAARSIATVPIEIERFSQLDEIMGKSSRTAFGTRALPEAGTKEERDQAWRERYEFSKKLKAAYQAKFRELEKIADAIFLEMMPEQGREGYKGLGVGVNMVREALMGLPAEELNRSEDYKEAYRRFLREVPKRKLMDLRAAELDMQYARGVIQAHFPSRRPQSAPSAPSRPFVIDGFTGTVESREGTSGNRIRTYRIAEEEAGSPVAVLTVAEQDDGTWEAQIVKVEPSYRNRGIASKLVAAIEADLGMSLSPSGLITPEAYAALRESDPEAVQHHQPGGPAFDGMFLSPKAVEFASAVLGEVAARTGDKAVITQQHQLEALKANIPAEVTERERLRAELESGSAEEGSANIMFAGLSGPPNPPRRLTPAEIDRLEHRRYSGTIKEEVNLGHGQTIRPPRAAPLTDAEKAEGITFADDVEVEAYGLTVRMREQHLPDGKLRIIDVDTGYDIGHDEIGGSAHAERRYAERVAWRRVQGLPDEVEGMGPWHPDWDHEAWRAQHPLKYRHPLNEGVLFAGLSGPPNPIRLGRGRAPSMERPESSLSDLVTALVENLGIPLRYGRLDPGLKQRAGRQGKALAGQFSRATGVARLAIPNDLKTLAHEGGHALEVRPSIKDDLDTLKRRWAEELTTPLAPNLPVPPAPAAGFWTELDADTQRLLAEAVETDAALRVMAAQVGQAKAKPAILMRPKIDQEAYAETQRRASLAYSTLIRRVGQQRAQAFMKDVRANTPQGMTTQDYIAQRFSSSGVPIARPTFPQPSDEELSEAFAEWFRQYITNPARATSVAPQFHSAFTELLDGAEPDLLRGFEAVQEGYQALLKASPVGALRSRVQSTVKPGIIAQFRQDVAEKGLGGTIADHLYDLYRAFVDGRHPMKVAVKYLLRTAEENMGIKLSDKERLVLKAIDDPYKLWRLSEHSKVWATAALQDGIRLKGEALPAGPSFHEALAKAFGGTARGQWNEEKAELFGSYLIARRMLAEFERFDRGELEREPDVLMNRPEWAKARRDLEKAYPEFAEAAELLYQFNRRHLKNKYLNGFLSRDLFLELNARQDYVPLNRVMDEGAPSQMGLKAKGQNKRKVIFRFQGSTRDFINPLESIAQDVYATTARIALNDVIRAMDRLARAAGPGGGAIAERIPPTDIRGTRVDIREAIKQAARQLDEADAQGLIDIVDDLFDQNASVDIFRAVETNEKGESIVYLWEDGKRIPIRLGDTRVARDIFEAMVALGQANSEPLMDAMAFGTQLFRAGVTKAPAYVAINFLRDQLATWVLSRDFTPIVTGARGLKSIAAGDDVARQYRAFAGLSGVESNLVEAASGKRDVLTLRRKGILAAPSTWGSVLRFMETTEAVSRMGHFKAAYDRAIADGFTEEEAAVEAAYAAHDVLDFSRRGAKMVQIARIFAFMNAALQALDAAMRTIVGERDIYHRYRTVASPYIKAATGQPLSLAEKEALPNSARIWVKMAVIGMLGVALAALYRDDDEYEEFNDYMKATHWFFKVGGIWWRIPKPFELAVLSNAFEAAFDRYWKQDPRALTRFLESLRHTTALPADIQGYAALKQVGQIPAVAWEAITGMKDPYRKDEGNVVPIHMQGLPPEMQFTAYTSELSRLLGNVTGTSPAKWDRFITDTFATVGRDVMALSDQLLPPLNQALGGVLPGVSKTPRAEKSIEDYWIISRFTRREARASLSGQIFWQQMSQSGGKYVAAAAGYKDLIKSGNTQAAKDLLDSLPDDQRAYAILEAHFKENDQDLHPLNRARQVTSAVSDIRRSMLLDRLFKTTVRGGDQEKITLSPSQQRIVNEVLEDLAMREQRNALILIGHPGWAQKNMMPTEGLLNELKAAAPEVAEELDARLTKGRYKVYPFEGIRKVWPKVREEVLKNGADASLVEFRAEAKYP